MDFAAMNPARPPPLSPWASEHTISPKPPPYDSLYDISPPAPVVPLQGSFPGLHSRLDPVFNSGPSRARPPPVHQTRPAPTDLSISHLREALNSLDSKVASLLSERDVLESRLESAVRLQSPVHRLPSELLASMFVTAVTGSGEEDSWTLSTIMLVCRHWNEIASNIPDLWCRVVAGIRHPLAKVQLKLERSKSIPLHICVDFSPKIENGTVTTESIVRTMDLLRTSIWRWKTFRLIVPNRPQAHAALMRCTDGAPLLELLSIRVSHSMQDDHHYSTPPRPLFEGQTPSLTSCSLTSFNFGWDIRLVSRLRTLNLSGYWNGFSPSVDVILSVLRACPQLEEIALRNMSDVDGGSCSGVEPGPSDYIDTSERPVRVEDNRMIHLPRLVKASFYYSGTIRTRTILSLITCPALEWVDLCFLDNVSPMIEELRRQSLTCLPLRHLRIESSFFSEMKLLRLLQRVPSLNTLELVDVEDASSNLLKNLSSPQSSQTWICPKLTNLSLEGCTTLDWEALRSVVESRLPAQSRAYPKPNIALPAPRASLSSSSSAAAAAAGSRPSSSSSTSSASTFAATAHILAHTPTSLITVRASSTSGSPQRLQSIDLTRCHQISKEMVQWLRMYVLDVKCETPRAVWLD